MAGKKGKGKKKKSVKIGFSNLTSDILKKSKGKYTPEQAKAIAASIGRKKYGAKAMAKKAAAGRRKAAKKRK
jgi:hypothetical protein